MKEEPLRLDTWTEGYLDYLRDVRKLTVYTVRDFRSALRRCTAYLEKRRPGVPLWKCSLEDFLAWLNASREEGYHETGLAKELSHIRGLLEFSHRAGRCERNVLDGFSLNDQVPRQEPRVLTMDEVRALLRVCVRHTPEDRLRRLVVLLFYGCGLRTAELAALDVADVIVERQELFVRKGKGDIQRYVPVPSGVWVELLAHMAERSVKRGPLFRTEVKRRRLGKAEAGRIVREMARRAGIGWTVTPKTLRHTFGTHLMDRGVDIGVISLLMGHRGPGETGVYLHVMPGRREQAISRLPLKEALS